VTAANRDLGLRLFLVGHRIYPWVFLSTSDLISVRDEKGYGQATADAIDATVARLATDRDVMSVIVTPITYGYPDGAFIGSNVPAYAITRTSCVIVTVVYRDESKTPR
jgi:hypothetical protein